MTVREKTGLLADPFCIYPFSALNVMPSGQVKPCCAYTTPIQKDGAPMSVYEHSLEEIWNSRDMRDLRRDLSNGKPAKGCSYCYRQEASGMKSMGTVRNESSKAWTPEDRAELAGADYRMAEGVSALDLDVGNLCNLKCRMCNSSYSSAIAADPVHSRWAPPGPVAARWRGDGSVIAPNHVLGVTYAGLTYPAREDGTLRSWVHESANVKASVYGVGVSGFSIQLFAAEATEASIYANEVLLETAQVSGRYERRFDVEGLEAAAYLDVKIVVAGGPVAVEAVKLLRSNRGGNKLVFSRFENGEQWFQSEAFMAGELLERAESLEIVQLIGGEPLLIKEAQAFARGLIERGVAQNITLAITTNGTQAGEEWIGLLTQFKKVYLAISLDGFGAVNEFIRYPSEWAVIDRNIRAFAAQSTIDVRAAVTVQAYNALRIVELVDYCEEVGILFSGHLLQYPPHLGIRAMPDAARERSVSLLRGHIAKRTADAPDWAYAVPLESLAAAIERESYSPEENAKFWTFTREMDASRGQSLPDAMPELYALMQPPA
ncbi:SPASM domain-containing protein [Paragemmobacter aquarius]|nr:SPASM domain-containing protein [Gemmobacter aquarius]